MIVLLGYMGSGKTAASQHLAALLGKDAIDLDALIEKQESGSVRDIFEQKGAIYFRKKEREALEKVLTDDDVAILSLGGGTPCYYNNMDLIASYAHVTSFYLQASVSELLTRLTPEMAQRPLLNGLKSPEELADYIGKHLFERSQFYNKATFTIKTDGKNPEEVAREIVATLF